MLLCSTGAALFQETIAQETESDTTGVRSASIYPLPILFYTPETGIAGGAAALYKYRDSTASSPRPSSMTGDAIYTEKKQIVLELNGDFYLDQGRFRLLANTYYKNFPNSFYGIGNNVPSSSRESYISRSYIMKVVLYRNIFSRVNLAPLIRYESTSILGTKEAGLLASGAIPGNSGGTVSGAGVVVNWDSRDNTFSAYSGSFYQLTAIFNSRVIGSDFNYTDLDLDLRNFFEMFSSQVLALQTGIFVTAGTVPFQNLVRFGGQDFFSGYFDGQYRDATGIGGQVKYRIPV